jgi:hypothetical protein
MVVRIVRINPPELRDKLIVLTLEELKGLLKPGMKGFVLNE